MREHIVRIIDFLALRGYRPVAVLLSSFLVLGLLEVAGIASIMPFMQLVSDPTVIRENEFLSGIYAWTGFQDERSFLIVVGVGVLLLLTAANAMQIVVIWISQNFVWKNTHLISTRLLRAYTDQPYEFFLGRNSADLGNKLLSEVDQVARAALLPVVQLVAKGFVAVSIIGLLLFVDVVLALIVAASLGIIYAVVYLKSRASLTRMGKRRLAANRARFKSAGEAFGNVKMIKATGTEKFFVNRFARASKVFTSVQPRARLIAQAPINIVRSVAFGGILLIILYLLAVEGNLKDAVPILSLYALAGYKLMPSLQHVFQSVSTLRFQKPALEAVHADLFGDGLPRLSSEISRVPVKPLRLEREIRLETLTFSYSGYEEEAVKDVSLVIPCGSTIGIVGPTGSGKSTLVDCLVSLLFPTKGRLTVDGEDITEVNACSWQRSVGYVPQEVVLYDDTITRNIVFGLEEDEIDFDRVRMAARLANIDDFIMTALPETYETRVGERGVRFSGGQRQRIGLARALYRDPHVLILDEATSALDGITEDAVMSAIDQLDHEVTIIMVAHRLATVRACDTIYLMDRGRVVAQGTYSDLMESNQVFREMARAAG